MTASSSASDASSFVGNSKTPRMANLDDHGDPAAATASETKPTSSSKDRKSKTTASDALASSSAHRTKSKRSSSSRRNSRSSSFSAVRPPITPLKNHNSNSSVGSNSPSLSATGLIQTADLAVTSVVQAAEAATTIASPPLVSTPVTKSKSTSSSSRMTPSRRDSSDSFKSRVVRDKYHRRSMTEQQEQDKSWTYHEHELNSLLLQASGSDAANPAAATADCLDVSMQMLQSSIQQAKQAVIATPRVMDCSPSAHGETTTARPQDLDDDYGEDEEDDDQYTQQTAEEDGKHEEETIDNNTTKKNESSTSSWWMSIVQRLQDSHEAERFQWKDDLRVAKIQGKQLKSELRQNIEQRIQWLEERLAWEDQIQQRHGGVGRGGDTIPSVSSATTMVTASTFGNYTNYTVDERNSLYQSVAGAGANGVEVSFDTAQAIQRLGELEQRVKDFEYEKEQWEQALAHAEVELQKDKKLSSSMQEQLQRLALEVESYSDTNHKHCKEKQKVQKQLIQLLEQQLATERVEWQQEKELLDHTIQQLTLDKAQSSVDMRNTMDKLQRLAREEKKLRAQRETWIYDRDLMEINIQQLLTDKTAYKVRAENLRRELMDAKQRLGEPMDGENESHEAPAVESVYSELDENLDRAIAERDLYKQEAENLRKTLEEERARWLESEAAADETVSEIRSEFGAMVDELKARLKKATSNSSTKADVDMTAETEGVHLDEQQLKQIQDEYTAVIEDLEARLDSQQTADAQRLAECLAKNKDLVTKLRTLERQHADERGEWKLRLESALAEGRKLRETKEALEAEIRELKESYNIGDGETPLNEQLSAALADSERLQLELANLRQNYEAEVQAIFDEAKARESPTNKGEWKLQLEAALAETRRVRRLKEDLEVEIRELRESFEKEKIGWLESGNVNVDDVRRELNALAQKADRLEEENNSLKGELETLQSVESRLQHQKDLYADLKEKYDREAQEWSAQLDESRLHEEVELEELKSKMTKETNDLQKAVRREQKIAHDLKEKLEAEVKGLRAKLLESDQKAADKISSLSDELRKLKSQYAQAKTKWEGEIQRLALEKDGRIRELELTLDHAKEQASSSERLLTSVTKLIDGLRADIMAVKSSVESVSSNNPTADNSALAELKTSIEEVQNGLNDTIAELTLEADAIMEIKTLVEAFTADAKADTKVPAGFHAEHSEIVSKVSEIHAQIKGLVGSGSGLVPNNAMYQEAVTELQRKISQVAELQAKLELAEMELERKSTQLTNAEAEVMNLNDQTDAYNDEIMRIQAINADLEKNLRLAERKIQALLNAPDMPRGQDDFDEYGHSKTYDDSTPMLEEALALAHGLQELVQGRDSDQNVLEMLQSLSDLMDHHERADEAISRTSSNEDSIVEVSEHKIESMERPYSPQRRQQVEHRDPRFTSQEREEPPPDPVNTPLPQARRNESNVSLHLVVEQLYGRCQMLERERTEMMEVTLNLLESARKSNAAEMDAALATVRRRTMEDVIRVRQQTLADHERMYQRLCMNTGVQQPSPVIAVDQSKVQERGRHAVYAE